ncbi:hypothetical protein [Picosynechococcus sp. PCC 7117]
MDLSQLKWLKNVNPGSGWAYADPAEMPLPEAKIFRLEWKKDRADAQKPNKGDLIALVQHARVTHIVEVLDDTVYDTKKAEWGLYRVVKAIWMPPKGFNWAQLPHQEEIFGVKHLPSSGHTYAIPIPSMRSSPAWQEYSDLQGFQEHVSEYLELLCPQPQKKRYRGLQGRMQSSVNPSGEPTFTIVEENQ